MSTFLVMGRRFDEMQERAALIKVERALRETDETFDMNSCMQCVGHFVGRAMGMTKYEAAEYVKAFSGQFKLDHDLTTLRNDHPLRALYFPDDETTVEATAVEAADATARYLLGGEPWPEGWA